MHPVLIIQNQPNDGPAYLRTWLHANGVDYHIVEAWHQTVPSNIRPWSALAVLGGAMSANDPTPNLFRTQILILQAVHSGIPVAGHCLGGQLLAKALGGIVEKSPMPEVGWQRVEWFNTTESIKWFGARPTTNVMHWHYEAFTLPEGAVLLASSPACPNQAFSYGPHIGMQFHIEVDADKVAVWASETEAAWSEALGKYGSVQDIPGILSGITPNMEHHQKTAGHLYRQWLSTTGWAEKLPVK